MDEIYVSVEGTIRVTDDTGSLVKLTCVEGAGNCYGCYMKRESGKPQKDFCKAVLCGAYERIDGKDVIFQHIKIKNNNN